MFNGKKKGSKNEKGKAAANVAHKGTKRPLDDSASDGSDDGESVENEGTGGAGAASEDSSEQDSTTAPQAKKKAKKGAPVESSSKKPVNRYRKVVGRFRPVCATVGILWAAR
jgi:hypothetical protein